MSEQTTEFDQIAEWLGDMAEAYNVTDYTDEQTTFITVDVDTLARRIAQRIAARQAALASDFAQRAHVYESHPEHDTDRYLDGFSTAMRVAERIVLSTPSGASS